MYSSILPKTIGIGFAIFIPTIAIGGGISTTTTTFGPSAASQTSSVPVYESQGGTSFNLQSTTTVNGGYQTSGSGNIIPSTNTTSQSNTSYGVGITIPFSTGN